MTSDTRDTIAALDTDLGRKYAEWLTYLSVEKRFSPHTLRAYRHDLDDFLAFLTRHIGKPPRHE